MTLKQAVKNKILKFLGLEHLKDNPNDERYQFISDDERIRLNEIRANKVWYIGKCSDIDNYYLGRITTGWSDNVVHNKNERNYFHAQAETECKIKKIHSGIPNAITMTLTNIIGKPDVNCDVKDIWEKIEEENDFYDKLVQQGRPLTLVTGSGAWKPNFNKKVSKYPLWEFYDAEYIEYIVKCGVLFGIIFKSYYKDKKNNNYVLLETRYKNDENSYIDYDLYLLKNKSNEIEKVPLETIPELAGIKPQVINGLNEILAVPSRYFYDSQNPKYGRSIYAGKLDYFDMLDEIWSQASQTNRVSTPVEYYSPDVLSRGPNGQVIPPHAYNRQFIERAGIPDGDGNLANDIITTQPELNFDKYGNLAQDVLNNILTGILSPATLGIDVARKDNATAQREKEKQSIMTRNNIIARETGMMKKIVKLSIYLYEYMNKGLIELKDYNINVKYNEFANPAFENQIQILGSAWANGEISTTRYVDLLWLDKLTDEEKLKEVEWLDNHLREDLGGLDDLSGIEELTQGITEGEGREEEAENGIPNPNK